MTDRGWEPVIGLEIHAQLATRSKIFSGAPTAYGAPPNTQACAVDLGLPGVLPVLNREAVRMAVRFGLAIGARVSRRSVFARKNYFYPDLPKGYQISQYELPIVAAGHTEIAFEDGTSKRVGITRAHLEEDAGKSLHEDFRGRSGIDLNRAGTPLLEIVSEPDLRSAQEAVAYMRKIHTLVRYLGICDGNMQEGSFRCDANVSVRKTGEPRLGTRAEVKNLNSFRFVERAIHHEIERQITLLEAGGTVVLETRLYDPDRDETRPMREKEEANDYRYFPDPDLLPLVLSEDFIEALRAEPPSFPMPSGSASSPNTGCRPMTPRCYARAASRRLLRGGRRGERRTGQTLRQLGHGRGPGGLEPRGKGDRRVPDQSRHARGLGAPYHRWHHLGQDRQRGLRGHVAGRRRCRRR